MNLRTAAVVASGLISGGVLAAGAYWYASPYLAVNSIREAIAQKDGERLNQYVDYPQLRDDLKAYVVSSLRQAASDPSSGDGDDGLAALGTALVIPIANTLIDSYLTPEVVEGLIESSAASPAVSPTASSSDTSANPFSIPDIQAEIAKGKQQVEKTINQMADVEMRYQGMNQFQVSGRVEPGIKLGFDMVRQGLGDWKIAGLILPNYQQLQALAAEDADGVPDELTIRPDQDLEGPTVDALDDQDQVRADAPNPDRSLANAANGPLAGQGRGVNAMAPDRSTCWFQMQRGSGDFTGLQCTVVSRVNANGNTVYDVIDPNGVKRAIVLWDDSSAEVYLRGQRTEGVWQIDPERDVQIQLPQETLAFRRPAG